MEVSDQTLLQNWDEIHDAPPREAQLSLYDPSGRTPDKKKSSTKAKPPKSPTISKPIWYHRWMPNTNFQKSITFQTQGLVRISAPCMTSVTRL